MNAPAFTPGPWRLDGSSSIYALNLEGTNRFYASVQSGWSTAGRNRTSEAELAANANLIAAAPELYETLAELLRVDDEWHGAVNSEMSVARSKARTALARARGETP